MKINIFKVMLIIETNKSPLYPSNSLCSLKHFSSKSQILSVNLLFVSLLTLLWEDVARVSLLQ